MIGPVFGYINKNTDNNNFINVRLPDNVQFVNATVILHHYNSEKKQIRQNIVGGVGYGGDQSRTMSFGINKDTKVDKIIVKTIYGKTVTIDNPTINKTIMVDKELNFKYR